jgi:hypothetical protein
MPYSPRRPDTTRFLLLLAALAAATPIAARPGAEPARQAPAVFFPLPSLKESRDAAALKPADPEPLPGAPPERLVERLDAFSGARPPERHDLEAYALAIEPGVEPAFQFVRDRIAFESYPGALRGPHITYAARAGNAIDRSILLSLLLERQGIETRFAFGRLPRGEAEALFERIFNPPDDGAPAPAPDAGGARTSLRARLLARARRDHALIRAALGDGLPAKAGPSRDEVIAEIQSHAWVQAKTAGGWLDLDASFGGAVPGKAHCAAESTAESLPREAYQLVTIRVLAEILESGKLAERKAFEAAWPAAFLLDRDIFLIHLPGSTPGLAGALAAGEPDSWRPTLVVEGRLITGAPIGFADRSPGRGEPPRAGLGGAFGRGGALASDRRLVAEWLELEVQLPGGGREVSRRALVDRAGAVWRGAAAPDPGALRPLARDKEGALSPRTVHCLWLTAGRHNLAAFADAARHWARSSSRPPGAGEAGPPSFRDALWPFAFQNAAHVVLSDHLIVPSLNDSAGVRFYAGAPRAFLASLGTPPDAGADGGTCAMIDLFRDRLRGLARDDAAAAAVAERRIWFGALQGALEHEALAPFSDPARDGAGADSTSARFDGKAAVLLRPEDLPRLAGRVRGEAAALAARALAAGHRLVVPGGEAALESAAWWEVAPDGTTRAVLGEHLSGSRFNFPPTGVPLGRTGGARGAAGSPPGVVPVDPYPSPMMRTDPDWRPDWTNPNWEPDFTVRSSRRLSDPNAPTNPRARPARPQAERTKARGQGGGGGNEYTMIIRDQAVPNPLAVLDSYVDRFLVGSAEVASRLASILDDLFLIFR